jgi:hypothetical protein
LDCNNATFETPNGYALSADGLEARGYVFLREVTVRGQARFLGARLRNDLDCDQALFEATEGAALEAHGLAAEGSIFLRGATVQGEARFLSVHIGRYFYCDGATFEGAGRQGLNLDGANISGTLYIRNQAHVSGILDLSSATLGNLNDDPLCWPVVGNLFLDRCQYGAFTGGPVDAAKRLDWLARQNPARRGVDFWPQPYQQLAKVLHEMGHEDEAKTVLIEKEHRLRAAELRRLPRWRKPLHWGFTQLLRMVGYGHRPALALVPALAVVLLGAALVHRAADAGVLVAARPAEAGAPVPVLVPLAYSVEAFVPIVELGQTDAFRPDLGRPWGYRLQVYLWLHGFAGWLIGGIAAAGILGLFRRA